MLDRQLAREANVTAHGSTLRLRERVSSGEMIDLHNHILPGLDDGAADLAESLEIARQFVSEGVTAVAATPHLDPSRESGAPAPLVDEVVAHVRAAIQDAGIGLDVVRGQELYFTPEALPLIEQGEVCTLGGSRSILIELPFDTRPLYLDDALFRAQLAGFQLILGHPERYSYVQRDVAFVEPLVERGVAMQVTAPALLGEYGSGIRRVAESLIVRGYCALVGSDRHHPGPARSLALAHDRVTDLAGPETADLLLKENPRRVLESQPLVRAEPVVRPKQTFFDRLRGRRR